MTIMIRLLLIFGLGVCTLQIFAQNISSKPASTFQAGALSNTPATAITLKGVIRTSDGKPAASVNVQLK